MSEADLYKAAEGLPERQGKTPEQWFDFYSKEHGDTYEPFDASGVSAFSDMARYAPESVGGVLGGIWEAVSSPVKTAKAMTSLLTGRDTVYDPARFGFISSEDGPVSPTVFRGADVRRAFVDAYKERYGSIESAANTVRTDPAGFLSDVALIPTGAGAALKTAGTVGRVAAKVAGKAGATTKAGKAAAVAGRVSDAGRAMMTAADVIDPATAIPLTAVRTASAATAPLRSRFGRVLHDSLFPHAGGLHTADEIQAAQKLAWEEGIGPGRKGRAYIDEQMGRGSTARDQAVADTMATNDPALMFVSKSDIVEPHPALVAQNPRLKPLSGLWDEVAASGQPGAIHTHTGYFDAVNQYLGERTGERFGLDPTRAPAKSEVNNAYANRPYSGEFEPVEFTGKGAFTPANPHDPALMKSVDEVNQQRKAANLRKSQFEAARSGAMDDTATKSMGEKEASFVMNNNARNLLYMKFEEAGITPPSINGKPMTWKEFGERDRNLVNLEGMIEAAQKNLALKGHGDLSPYYWSSRHDGRGHCCGEGDVRFCPG
jgi:hypothetical protein